MSWQHGCFERPVWRSSGSLVDKILKTLQMCLVTSKQTTGPAACCKRGWWHRLLQPPSVLRWRWRLLLLGACLSSLQSTECVQPLAAWRRNWWHFQRERGEEKSALSVTHTACCSLSLLISLFVVSLYLHYSLLFSLVHLLSLFMSYFSCSYDLYFLFSGLFSGSMFSFLHWLSSHV